MKYAVISDIHAHLAALQAVLRDAQEQGCTHTACLGDIVGYYNKPKECVDLIRQMNIPCVKGNHDEYCSSEEALEGFKPPAPEMVAWTRNQLAEGDRRWLGGLPLILNVSGFTIVHGSLDGPERWGYVFDKLAAAASLAWQKTPVCFFGHTHVAVAFVRDTMVRGGTFSKFRVEPGKQYFINVGSVGQPRDGTKQATYVTYDLDEGLIELRRVNSAPPEPPPDGGESVPWPTDPRGPRPHLRSLAEPEE